MQPTRFPPEVLSEIFMECLDCPPWVDHDGSIPNAPGDAPFLLTRICRHWRAVSMSTPRLWTYMFLPDLPNTRKKCKLLFSQVAIWLSLSKSLPLSFVLRFDSDFCSRDMTARYLALLFKEIHRWKSVQIGLGLGTISWMPVVQPGSMNLLEDFYFDGATDHTSTDVPTIMTFLASAPLLSNVEIVHDLSHKWVLPWANLTVLNLVIEAEDMSADTLEGLCDNLHECVNLSDLELAFQYGFTGEVLPPTSDVVLPTLDYLVLKCNGTDVMESLVHTFVTPRLSYLSLECLNRRWYPEPSASLGSSILAFLKESGGAIETLSLTDMYILPREIVSCLSLLPNLEGLYLFPERVDAEVFEALTLRFDDEGHLIFGNNLHLRAISCLTAGIFSFSDALPQLPFSMRHPLGDADCTHGHNAPQLITFLDNQPPREDLTTEKLSAWFSEVSNPAFCRSFARMLESRWLLPPGSKVQQLQILRFVHFDLHILERMFPEGYVAVMRCWDQGLNLNVWSSLTRIEYWRSIMHM